MKVVCDRCGALAEGRLEARPGGAAVVCGACGAAMALEAPGAAAASLAPGPPSPGAAGGEGPGADDDAWAGVLSRWDDEEAHRAFLSRFADLDGLAQAGRRYREVLRERPGDAAALRWREEILRRAAAQGLSQLPRPLAARVAPAMWRWAVLAGMIAALALAAGWVAFRLLGPARP